MGWPLRWPLTWLGWAAAPHPLALYLLTRLPYTSVRHGHVDFRMGKRHCIGHPWASWPACRRSSILARAPRPKITGYVINLYDGCEIVCVCMCVGSVVALRPSACFSNLM